MNGPTLIAIYFMINVRTHKIHNSNSFKLSYSANHH